MDEYINRREFLEHMQGTSRYFTVKFDIENFPAADVAPARHARWEVVVGSDGKERMVCTGCRKQQDLTGVFSYCPNCGALMDGERKDEANES